MPGAEDEGGDAGDGQCHVPRQHVGRHAEPDDAFDQRVPTKFNINVMVCLFSCQPVMW